MFILACICSPTHAKTIDIKSTHTYIENGSYYIDALFDLALTDEAENALRHGISFEIHTQFQLRLKRNYFWDKTINEKKIIYKLEHKPLTENFQTIDLKTGLRNSHDNLNAAINHIKSITKVELFDLASLQKNKNYIARIRTYLDISSLPSPMRPQAYFSSSWEIESKWHEWEIVK
jgi:uncharacterized protein DUF4390